MSGRREQDSTIGPGESRKLFMDAGLLPTEPDEYHDDIVKRLTVAAAGHDQHAGSNEFIPDMTGRAGVPRSAGDAEPVRLCEPTSAALTGPRAAHEHWHGRNVVVGPEREVLV